jgi:hypothetical protein
MPPLPFHNYLLTMPGDSMSQIYQPQGRAQEYSPYALNYFKGCSHDCVYCYARNVGKRCDRNYVHTDVQLQNVTLDSITKDCGKHAGQREQVLLSFMSDPYMNGFDTSLTRHVLEQMLEHRIPVAVLTKAPRNAVRDFELMSKFGESLIVGTTITTLQNFETVEPHADTPLNRIGALTMAKKHGLTTWISMEPAYSVAEGLAIIELSSDVIDRYRLGKMNYRKLPVDWTEYVVETVDLLRSLGKSIYVKNDLAVYAPQGFLTSDERNARLQDAKPFRFK